MPVTDVTTDAEALTMTLTAEFDAPVDRLWSAFSDPRQLERFWGPPGWPATFPSFDFTVGGHAKYFMTSPQGEKSWGSWEFLEIDAPTGFTVPVRAVRAYTGAGWLVALCGDMQTMPGLSASPAAFNVDIDENGRTVGLF